MNDRDIEQLCERYGAMVLRRCRRLLGVEEDARDACQDVFLKLVQQQDRMTVEYPSSLLYRMATNICLNRLRDAGRRPPTRDADVLLQIAAVDAPGDRSHARLLLARLFGRHSESVRTMAVLHYVDGLTLEEVARETGTSVSGVRRRLRTLRRSLQELVS